MKPMPASYSCGAQASRPMPTGKQLDAIQQTPDTRHLYDTSSFMKLVSALPPRSTRRMAAGSTRQSNTGTCKCMMVQCQM